MKYFSRSQAVVVIFGALVLLIFYGWRQFSSSDQPDSLPRPDPFGVVVQVSGKVRSPGTYPFDHPVTVSEVVATGGGLHPHLRSDPRWERLRLSHGRHLHMMVGRDGMARLRLGWMAVPSLLVLGVQLDLNRASAEELSLVPGLRRQVAEGIVAHRQHRGAFLRVEDLDEVRGIGPVTVERLRPYLTVSGKR
jgi:competence protein ComEA